MHTLGDHNAPCVFIRFGEFNGFAKVDGLFHKYHF